VRRSVGGGDDDNDDDDDDVVLVGDVKWGMRRR